MVLYKNKYRIESTRLPGWNYGGSGWYFVTICTKDMVCYFGKVIGGEMKLSVSGCKVVSCWLDIPSHF
ncbi:hypothetical protein C0581_03115 [Candidatus Parcubacteria bacterium]|nr:MAG: hypothetical protein C0581_03115 [Candidatus Parcubacteria bacterium]